ncbi:transcription factor [Lunasporangiospora selenospora]|uniref:Transcription factor n=1 Tax=Lunasporangiospora selenospora TaxID=979761 RepID=A0A9P6G334_9FUNG|nr:transcription factor [Lunasporangiospora selenospora]
MPSLVLEGSYEMPVIVGRGSQATLNLGRINKQVSRRHAIVQWSHEAEVFQINVLGQNGIRINGVGYPSGRLTALQSGDIVDLVGVKMVFRAPAGSSTQQYLGSAPVYTGADVDDNDSDHNNDEDEDEFGLPLLPQGLVTPKRNRIMAPQELVSPARDQASTPPQLTPTARMRHKAYKYDFASNGRAALRTPPPSSDLGTECGTSPIRSMPDFELPSDMMPMRKMTFGNLDSPRTSSNIFYDGDDDSLPPKTRPTTNSLPKGSLVVSSSSPVNSPGSKPHSTSHFKSGSSLKATSPSSTSKKALAASPSATGEKTGESKTGHSGSKMGRNDENAAPVNVSRDEIKTKKSLPKPVLGSRTTTNSNSNNNINNNNNIGHGKEQSEATLKKSNVESKSKMASLSTPKAKAEKSSEQKIKQDTTLVDRPTSTMTKAPKPDQAEKKDSTFESPLPSPSQPQPQTKSGTGAETKKAPMDYTEMIIDTLVFARKKKSMTLSELYDEMVASQPSIVATQDESDIKSHLLDCLSAARCVGKIARKGKDAYNKPLESQWYYIPECDHNVMRKLTRQEVMPSARKCTLKMPPKLPYHRKSTSPYAVKQATRRSKDSSKLALEDADNGDVTPSSSDEEENGNAALSATNKKRKSAHGSQLEKKRRTPIKSSPTNESPRSVATGEQQSVPRREREEEEEEEEDDEEGAHNDSLDDMSELSGLSD